MEHFRNREKPNALEMKNLAKSVTSFLNSRNARCFKLELIPTCFFYKLPRGPLLGDTNYKVTNFCLVFIYMIKAKWNLNRWFRFDISRPCAICKCLKLTCDQFVFKNIYFCQQLSKLINIFLANVSLLYPCFLFLGGIKWNICWKWVKIIILWLS